MSHRNGLLENNPDGLNRRPGAPQSTDRSTFGTAAMSRDCHVGLVASLDVYGKPRACLRRKTASAPRWINSQVNDEFSEPPASISTKSGGGRRSVLTGLSGEDPEEVLGAPTCSCASRVSPLTAPRMKTMRDLKRYGCLSDRTRCSC
jgi:hypothetical protein